MKKKSKFGVRITLIKDWEQFPKVIRKKGTTLNVTREKAKELIENGFVENTKSKKS